MENTDNNILELATLKNGMPTVPPSFGEWLSHTASYCLEDRGHSNGVSLKVVGAFSKTFKLIWDAIDDRTRRFCQDAEVATEHGAYGIAFLLIKKLTDYNVIERSKKGPGFDFWLGKENDSLFNNKARLEVSGIRNGDMGEIRTRVNQKMAQTKPSDGSLSAYIVVVEFSMPLSEVVKK